MEPKNRSTEQGAADLFAEAAARVQAGESLDTVLATYPSEYQTSLRELLTIVSVATQIHQMPAPIPSASHRAIAKQAFLTALAAKKTEHTTAASRPLIVERGSSLTMTAWLEQWWRDLQALFTQRTMRLAPVALALVVLWLVSTSLVTLAQSALPGDLTYPVKQWIQVQEIYLTPVERRDEVRRAQEQELVEDLKKIDTKAKLDHAIIAESSFALFHGFGEDHLKIGGLQVLTQYQPDPNQTDTLPTQVIGELVPGSIVNLRYQFLPGQQGAASFPVVQGISIEVISSQPLEPTPAPTAIPEPTNEPTIEPIPTTPPTCTVGVIPGWIPYNIRAGDNLEELAQRTGVTVAELRLANCLSTENILVGDKLLIPASGQQPGGEETATEQPTLEAELTPTLPISDTVTPEATNTPGDTATLTATMSITLPTPPVATVSISATVEATSTQPAYPTVTPTISVTIDVTSTPTPSVAPDEATPTPTPTVTDDVAVTPTPGETNTAEGTPTATTESMPTETATVVANADTETPTATPTDLPAENESTPTPTDTNHAPTITQTASPTDDAEATTEASDAPTPTEAMPTPTEPPTATEAPPTATEAPPTDTPIPTEPPPTDTPVPTEPPPTEPPPTEPPPTEPPAEPTATFTPSA
jgi:LysM repeat protein